MTKYSVPEDYWEEDEDEPDDTSPVVEVSMHSVAINDERPAIENYNGLQWRFLIDDGTITAVDKSHYCPGPGHTDPMGFRAWSDVPATVKRVVLRELNADDATDVVDIEATEEVAEDSWP